MSEPAMPRRVLAEPDLHEGSFLGGLFRQEVTGGVVALIAAAVALVWANSPWSGAYADLRYWQVGPLDLEHWAAEGALTVFFFVAGLELKRELVVGSLQRPADAVVPVAAACCGVAFPAALYLAVNGATGGDLGGWAVPAATDIAFALAVLAVVGSALPTSLRAFLLTLAVVDDLIVIVIIAAVYSSSLHLLPLLVAALAFASYAVGQRLRRHPWWLSLPVAVIAWWAVHESGLHATIAGVVLGLLTRVRPDPGEQVSPAEHLEHVVSPVSSALAVPFFALMSAGVPLDPVGSGGIMSPVVVGIVVGLVVGKPLGVFTGAWLVARFTRAELNSDLTWRDIAGASLVAGIGFTVSLLVADLAFAGALREAAKIGVLLGSLVAAVAGALVLAGRARLHWPPG